MSKPNDDTVYCVRHGGVEITNTAELIPGVPLCTLCAGLKYAKAKAYQHAASIARLNCHHGTSLCDCWPAYIARVIEALIPGVWE